MVVSTSAARMATSGLPISLGRTHGAGYWTPAAPRSFGTPSVRQAAFRSVASKIKMKKFKFLVFVTGVVLLVAFSREASAAYYSSGTLTSTNLLSGLSVGNIASFWYNAFSIPSGTTLKAQFSRDNTSWYNSSGTLNGWNNCTTSGGATINLSGLGWTGANFYYKMEFNSDGTNTPILEAIRVEYSPPNQLPICSAISGPSSVETNSESVYTAAASDSDGDPISYTWTADCGTFPDGNTGSSVTWKAPGSAGSCTISCDVSDGQGGSGSCPSKSVSVSAPPAYTPEKTMCDDSSGSGGGVVSALDIIKPDATEARSQRLWVVEGYDDVDFLTYLELQTMYGYNDPTTQTITNLSGIAGDGVYKVTAGDLTIASGDNPPCGLGFAAVIFVDNDLIIGRSFTDDTVSDDPLAFRNDCSSSLAFIVEKDVSIASNVNNIYGIFYAGGDVGMSTESSSNPLYVFGSLLAHDFNLNRNLGADNATYPAEQIIFMPKYFLTLKDFLGRSQVSWREVKSP